jgi:hypothetical protein
MWRHRERLSDVSKAPSASRVKQYMDCLTLDMKVLRSLEKSVFIYQPTRRHIPGDESQHHRWQNLKCRI